MSPSLSTVIFIFILWLPNLKIKCILLPILGQLVVCTLCSCVMKTKQIWLFSAHMLPLLARLCLVPLETIVIINKFAMIFTGLEVLYFLGSNLLVPYNLAKSAYRELVQVRLTTTHRQIKFYININCIKDLVHFYFTVLVMVTSCLTVSKQPLFSTQVGACEVLRYEVPLRGSKKSWCRWKQTAWVCALVLLFTSCNPGVGA